MINYHCLSYTFIFQFMYIILFQSLFQSYKIKCQRLMVGIKKSDKFEEHLLPFWLDHEISNYYFQQDNCSIHKSISTKNWFQENAIDVMDWPASSPDLNPKENLFGIISRRVYQDWKHFGSVQELKSAILKVQEAISLQILEELINSMPKRIGQVILRYGRHVDY